MNKDGRTVVIAELPEVATAVILDRKTMRRFLRAYVQALRARQKKMREAGVHLGFVRTLPSNIVLN